MPRRWAARSTSVYGFEDEAMLTRHVFSGHLLSPCPHSRDESSPVRRLTAADLMVVTDEDNDVFGGSRERCWSGLSSSAPHYGLVARSDAGLAHYCLGREGRLFDQIGPVVAGDDGIAAGTRERRTGVGRCAAGRRRCVRFTPPVHTSLRTLGFQAQRPLYRMCRRAGCAAASTGRGSGRRSSNSPFSDRNSRE